MNLIHKLHVYFLTVLFFSSLNIYAQQNIITKENGAKVISYSSTDNNDPSSDYGVYTMIDDAKRKVNSKWWTLRNSSFPHWAVIELNKKTPLSYFTFSNSSAEYNAYEAAYPDAGAKEIVIYTSPTNNVNDLRQAAYFVLDKKTIEEGIRIETADTKLLKVEILSNWGDPGYTYLGTVKAYKDAGNKKDLDTELKNKGFADLYSFYFDFGSASLRPESETGISALMNYLKNNPGTKIKIEGHTDNIGDDNSNKLLSEKRAEAVAGELVSRGADQLLIETEGFGETMPVADNTSVLGRASNRRVTIRIIK